jgi:hypothetical protein
MGAQLAEAALAFKGLADRGRSLLTVENKTGTLSRLTRANLGQLEQSMSSLVGRSKEGSMR